MVNNRPTTLNRINNTNNVKTTKKNLKMKNYKGGSSFYQDQFSMGGLFNMGMENNDDDDDNDIKICDPDKYMAADKKKKLKMRSACISYCEDKELACGGFDEDGHEIEKESICKELDVCFKTGSIWQIPKDVKRYTEMLMALLRDLDPGAAIDKLTPKNTPKDKAALEEKQQELYKIKQEVTSIIDKEGNCKSVLKNFDRSKALYEKFKDCVDNLEPNEKLDDQVLFCLYKVKDKIKEYISIKNEIFNRKMEPGFKGSLRRMGQIAFNKSKEKEALRKLTFTNKTKEGCLNRRKKKSKKLKKARRKEKAKIQSEA